MLNINPTFTAIDFIGTYVEKAVEPNYIHRHKLLVPPASSTYLESRYFLALE